MRLTDLNPKWYNATTEEPKTMAEADGVQFDCPGCVGTERAHRIEMGFASKIPNGLAWTEQGTGFNDLTFVDAPRGTRSYRRLGHPCHSHFNITNGEIDHYPDSTSP